jgi:Domain of unknown function (DUF5625)
MGPIAYSLCQKPILGVAMWLASACAIPPLFAEVPINLVVPETKVTVTFNAPAELKYFLGLSFEFESDEDRFCGTIVSGSVENCYGNTDSNEKPLSEVRKHPLGGLPIPFKVVIHRASDKSIVTEKKFIFSGEWAHDGKIKEDKVIGELALKSGAYTAEITNLAARSGFENVKTKLFLRAGGGK